MTKFAKILLLVLLMILPACSAATTPTIPAELPPTAAVDASSGYPGGEPTMPEVPTESYPGPPQPTDDPLAAYPKTIEVPQPKPGLGVVTGRVLEQSNNEVYLAPSLILGELVYSSDPDAAPPLVGFSEGSDPKAVQALTGNFVFQDIKPGSYAIVIWTPASSTLLMDSDGNTTVVEVQADQVLDLGDVFVP